MRWALPGSIPEVVDDRNKGEKTGSLKGRRPSDSFPWPRYRNNPSFSGGRKSNRKRVNCIPLCQELSYCYCHLTPRQTYGERQRSLFLKQTVVVGFSEGYLQLKFLNRIPSVSPPF